MIPDGLPGHVDAFKTEFGAAPDKAKATDALSKAGVTTPVTLNLQYTLGHYGPTSADEYGEIKRQLEATGLFKVSIQSTEYTTYSKQRRADAYPAYQLGWFPDFPDADNYISPFLVPNNFVGAHYCDDPKDVPTAKVGTRPCDVDKVLPLITTEQSATGAARTSAIEKIQTISATGQLPTIPLLQGKQLAVTGPTVTGVDKTLDSSFLFRFWLISKSS
jgi:peptide/nickel transport system substrate-binding protein